MVPVGPAGPGGAFALVGMVCAPPRGAGPWGYWMTARKTCRNRGVGPLARQFRTSPAPEAVALAYFRWMRRATESVGTPELIALRAGCVQGFREQL